MELGLYGQVLLVSTELQPWCGISLHHGQLVVVAARRCCCRRGSSVLGAADLRFHAATKAKGEQLALADTPAAAQPLYLLPHGGALLLQLSHPLLHSVHALTQGLVLPGSQWPANATMLFTRDGQAELSRATLEVLGDHEALSDGATKLELLEEEYLHNDPHRETLILRRMSASLQGEFLAVHHSAKFFLLRFWELGMRLCTEVKTKHKHQQCELKMPHQTLLVICCFQLHGSCIHGR